jgi:hypothetical protein
MIYYQTIDGVARHVPIGVVPRDVDDPAAYRTAAVGVNPFVSTKRSTRDATCAASTSNSAKCANSVLAIVRWSVLDLNQQRPVRRRKSRRRPPRRSYCKGGEFFVDQTISLSARKHPRRRAI